MLPETTYHRQLTLLPPDRAQQAITVIGAGGIGSVLTLCLAKMGCGNITLYDDDVVEDHNLPSQMFDPEQLGEKKVAAVADTVEAFTRTVIKSIPERWDGTATPIVLSAVDSMAARQEIYDVLKTKYGVALYIDARMGAEMLRTFALQPADPDQQRRYEKTLYPDAEASEEECTAKAIAYNTFVVGGVVASMVKHFLMDQPYPREVIFSLADYTYLKV
jgi:hypothetical protein